MATVRLAIEKATGLAFVVDRIPGGKRVLCWGDVVRTEGARTTHEKGGRTFQPEQVELLEVERTEALARELLEQTARVRGRRIVGPADRREERATQLRQLRRLRPMLEALTRGDVAPALDLLERSLSEGL